MIYIPAGGQIIFYLPNTMVQTHTDANTLTVSAINAAANVYLMFLIPTDPKYTVSV